MARTSGSGVAAVVSVHEEWLELVALVAAVVSVHEE